MQNSVHFLAPNNMRKKSAHAFSVTIHIQLCRKSTKHPPRLLFWEGITCLSEYYLIKIIIYGFFVQMDRFDQRVQAPYPTGLDDLHVLTAVCLHQCELKFLDISFLAGVLKILLMNALFLAQLYTTCRSRLWDMDSQRNHDIGCLGALLNWLSQIERPCWIGYYWRMGIPGWDGLLAMLWTWYSCQPVYYLPPS